MIGASLNSIYNTERRHKPIAAVDMNTSKKKTGSVNDANEDIRTQVAELPKLKTITRWREEKTPKVPQTLMLPTKLTKSNGNKQLHNTVLCNCEQRVVKFC